LTSFYSGFISNSPGAFTIASDESRSSSLTSDVIGKLRGRRLLLLQLGEGRLQLLDQHSLLEPAREVKEVRKKQRIEGRKLYTRA